MGKLHGGTISVFEFFERFPDEKAAIEYLEELRWGEEGVSCPHCDCERITKLKRFLYYLCKECRQKFNGRSRRSSTPRLGSHRNATLLQRNHRI